MTLPTRLALHLAVLGMAMVTAAVRPAHDDASRATAGGTPTVSRGVATVQPAVLHEVTRPKRDAKPRTERRPVRKPAAAHAAAPAPVATAAPAPAPTKSAHTKTTEARATVEVDPTPVRTTVKKTVKVSGPTGWAALDSAIHRIPTYREGAVEWKVSRKYSEWGTADWYAGVIYINPSVPESYLYDVALHEWSHELSVLDYGGDVSAATKAMNKAFGGSGLVGPERAADCMALVQGASWTHYTSCDDSDWRAAARRLVNGKPL
jgi:hypothetical protein